MFLKRSTSLIRKYCFQTTGKIEKCLKFNRNRQMPRSPDTNTCRNRHTQDFYTIRRTFSKYHLLLEYTIQKRFKFLGSIYNTLLSVHKNSHLGSFSKQELLLKLLIRCFVYFQLLLLKNQCRLARSSPTRYFQSSDLWDKMWAPTSPELQALSSNQSTSAGLHPRQDMISQMPFWKCNVSI